MNHIVQKTGFPESIANFLFYQSSCAVASSKSYYGCVPFENGPEEALQNLGKRPIHFEQSVEDLNVRAINAVTGAIWAREANATVTTYFKDTGILNTRLGHCDSHVMNMVVDANAYEKRIVEFFDKYLK